mmetsp:Transcript_100134/g.238742  ORF Transcript_100134/g.238742 Transcript_100134/m.238742 type:complete len:235 (-) Transcript_100134:3-707(-)|eukprot:CAMPEP_0181483676 /NCGR_PEP_ID=MMETSP1110-20121109/45557_1 /TAXON_ID=174948 /ORGANISM="Symbiodinium sp., Strain CCMP421" /LENGTH=234 /DNA_ID=CAMNT_0023609421 /DNA_START=102 /DNA_END=803 /DNA_ORIENTATION=+
MSSLKVKNTFLELDDPEESLVPTPRRASSEPPTSRSLPFDLPETPPKDPRDAAASETTGLADADVYSVCSLCTTSEEELAHADATLRQKPPAAPQMIVTPPPAVSEGFRAVALAAFSALATYGPTEMQPSCYGYQVVVKLPRQSFEARAGFLRIAQESVLQAAENSSATYVLGYRASPFLETPLGFSALLCHVPDSSCACWDILQWGMCNFGDTCRWAHPTMRATLNVMAAVLE